MAFASVSYTAAIWQSWGLKYIFRPAGEVAKAKGWESAPRATPVEKSPEAAARRWLPRGQSGTDRTERSSQQPTPQNAGAQQEPKAAQTPQFRPIPQEQWGAVWQEQFARTRPGKVAWTYWQLGADLLGARHPLFSQEGQDRRRQLVGQLLGALGHPAGTHTFWPAQLDLTEEPKAQPEIFWSGLKALGCRGLLIFGSQAAWPLLNTHSVRPLQSSRHNGIFVHILNDMDRLIADQEQFRQTVAYLRSSLHIFVR